MAKHVDLEEVRAFARTFCRIHEINVDVDNAVHSSTHELTQVRFTDRGVTFVFTDTTCEVTTGDTLDSDKTGRFDSLLAGEFCKILTDVSHREDLSSLFGTSAFVVYLENNQVLINPLTAGFGEGDQF